LWLEDYKYKQMAYTINKTDGSVITTITDGTVDNTTSVQLFGKSYSGFGEGLNENLVKLLENSASTSAPTAPLKGELWFDTSTGQLKVYDGTSFKPSAGAKSQSAAPTSPSAGDLWHDSDDDQLYVYTGSAFQLVGPVYTAGQTLSGWLIETLGSSGGNKVVSSMYAGNTRVAILSKETFTPSVTQSGFASIKAGFTLNSTLGAVFEGTNTQASQIDVSGTANTSSTVIAGGNFLRADAADTTTGALTIDTDSGIIVGDAQELTVTVSSNDVTIAQTSQDKDLKFTVNDGGVTKTPLTLTGADGGIDMTGDLTITGNLNVSGAYNYTSSNIVQHSDTFLKVNAGGSEADAGLIVETGDTDDARLFYDVSENRWSAGENQTYSKLLLLSDMTDDGDTNKGTKPLTTDASTGDLKVTTLTLNAVGTAITTSNTALTTVATIGQVSTYGLQWGGSLKTVSTSDPSGGSDGDFWFKYEA
jgi:D-Tyr-tRNAtyr deacylase